MSLVVETVFHVFAWMKGEPMIAASVAALLLGPGAALCWFGYHVTGVRLAPGATRPAKFRRRAGAIDRVEQRLASLCTALSILTDSTESGLRSAISGLERLAGPAADQQTPVAAAAESAADETSLQSFQGRSPRDIAIAQGVSEGEVRLRMRLQST